MNDLLLALRKEKKILDVRLHTMELFIQKQSNVISKTAYTEADITICTHRLKEVNLCIKAIAEYRKTNKITTT